MNWFSFPLSCFLALFLFLPSLVFAAELNEPLVFKKIVVLDLDDHTGKAYGEKIGKVVRTELEQMLRFDIASPEEVQVQYPLSTKLLGKIRKKLQVDAFIVGRVTLSHEIVTISLEILNGNGEVFALELLSMKEHAFEVALEKSVGELVAKLIHRIPYKAVITQIENGMVTLDAGRIHGVEIGSKASVFEIVGVERHPFTNEVISFRREDLGEILITQVDSLSATGKIVNIKKGAKILVHRKVDFIPSQKVIQESLIEKKELLSKKQLALESLKAERLRLTKETPKRPRGSLTVSPGFALNDFSFSSNELTFKRRTSPIPVVTFTGEYWFLSPIGLDVSYTASWIRFDRIDSTPIDNGASPYWVSAHLKYRYFFSRGLLSPQIVGSVGYRIYDFQVDQSDLKFFNDIRYRGIDIALAASYPVTPRIKGVLNIEYQPSLIVRENPATSGTNPSVYAYSIALTGYFKITDGVMFALGYYYQVYQANFSGVGTRNPPAGTTNAKIHDLYHGVKLSLVYEF